MPAASSPGRRPFRPPVLPSHLLPNRPFCILAATQGVNMTVTAEGARERILRAADELFYAKGIRNVGIDEIIAHAGVAKASLYKHFESKDLLVLAWVRQRHDEI